MLDGAVHLLAQGFLLSITWQVDVGSQFKARRLENREIRGGMIEVVGTTLRTHSPAPSGSCSTFLRRRDVCPHNNAVLQVCRACLHSSLLSSHESSPRQALLQRDSLSETSHSCNMVQHLSLFGFPTFLCRDRSIKSIPLPPQPLLDNNNLPSTWPLLTSPRP